MPAALTPPWKLHTPIREPPWEPAVMREKAAAAAAAQRSSRIISIGTPSRPSALFTRQTGKVETQPTPSCFRMRTMPVATSIVMDVVSFAWSRAVSLRVGALKHTMISRVPFPNCRSGVIGLAIAGNPENDGHLSPWQEAVGHEINPDTHKNGCANEATTGLTLGLFVMLFQDVVFG